MIYSNLTGKLYSHLVYGMPYNQFVVDNYFPLLNLNGILIIEDIQDSNHLDVLTSRLPAEHRSSVRTFDVRRTKGRYDDLIWTVTKTC